MQVVGWITCIHGNPVTHCGSQSDFVLGKPFPRVPLGIYLFSTPNAALFYHAASYLSAIEYASLNVSLMATSPPQPNVHPTLLIIALLLPQCLAGAFKVF